MPLNMVQVQDRTSQTTDSWDQLAEAKQIIASLQKENEELRAHCCEQQSHGIWLF